jgi:23S rRNA pseudouridine2605 synthase
MTGDRDTKTGSADKSDAQAPEGERIAKVMARAGLCSRRDAEAWIAEGRVSVNGKKLQSPAINVQPHDDVRVDGKPLPEAEKTRLFRYHKPRGLVTTAKDPEGRPTVFENLPDNLPRVISVGRLDLNSEGLLLLTNDGELARKLELPATGWVRRYRVRVNGRIDPASLTRLAEGIEVEGVRYGAIEAILDRQQGGNAWLTMSLTEGKNREIRKVCAFFGWTVSRLIRLSYGPFQLGHLERGEIEEVPGKVLRDQLGRPGAPEPLRPQAGQGGKARPPKPRSTETPRDARDRPAAGDKAQGQRRDQKSYVRHGEERQREDRRGMGDRPASRDAGSASREPRPSREERQAPGRRAQGERAASQRDRDQRKPDRAKSTRAERLREDRHRDDERPKRVQSKPEADRGGREDARRSNEKRSHAAAPHLARQDKYQSKGVKGSRKNTPAGESKDFGGDRPQRKPEGSHQPARTARIDGPAKKPLGLKPRPTKPDGTASTGTKTERPRPDKPRSGTGSRKNAHRQRRP